MAKLFGKIPWPSGPPEGEPRLHFWRLKKRLGLPQFNVEHLVIPFEAQGGALQKQTTRIWVDRNDQKIPILLSSMLPFASGKERFFGGFWALAMLSNYNSNFKAHKRLKSALSKGAGENKLPFSAAYEPTEEGYKQMTAARLADRFKKMTHFEVDNDRNIIAIQHPLDGVAKARGFSERVKNLRVWLKWMPLRTRMQLQKPLRPVRVNVPRQSLLARLVPSGPLPQQKLKPVPAKILRTTRR